MKIGRPAPGFSMQVGLTLVLLASGVLAAERPKGPDAAWWERTPDPIRPAQYEAIERRSHYVTMRDGVRLAVDVHLPAGLAADIRLPTILEQTRYYRSVEMKPERGGGCRPRVGTTLGFFVPRGYAYEVVDARGSGASFGARTIEYSDAEVKDGAEIVDWTLRQDWSDGKVGSTGQSYLGTTSEMLLRNHHPAIKAVMPTFSGYDFFTDIVYPGGIENTAFNQQWSEFNRSLDNNEQPENSVMLGPCPVDEDLDGKLLRQAIAEHANNFKLAKLLQNVTFRDDSFDGNRIDDAGLYHYQQEIDAVNVPVYAIVGQYDSGYALGAIHRFLTSKSPTRRMLLGPWNHGGRFFYAPGVREPTATSFRLDAEKLRFFDFYLKDIDQGFSDSAPVHYFTSGANQWRESTTWPPSGLSEVSWCFAADNRLDASCEVQEDSGVDAYTGGATAKSGEFTRWRATMGAYPVTYADRAEEDRNLLTYTSPPLTHDIEISGEPIVTIFAAVDGTDADFFVYLEEVTPDGQVNYVTEGQLRASRRRTGDALYVALAPTHSHLRDDHAELQPGEVFRMDFGLLPLSHVFAQGSRIRVTIAPADRSQFLDRPENAASWRIFRQPTQHSGIRLPIVTTNK